MGKSTTFEQQILGLIFNGTTIANLAQNASSPLTNLYISLHTANPATTAGSGTVNTQSASEASYPSYVRALVARSGDGWSISYGSGQWSAKPVSTITFATCSSTPSGGSQMLTYFAIGAASSGDSEMFYYGTISPSIIVNNGTVPQLTQATAITEA